MININDLPAFPSVSLTKEQAEKLSQMVKEAKEKYEKNKKYLPNQKLWKVVKTPEGYYYEIRLAGETIDRIRIEHPALSYLKRNGML